MSHDLYIGAYWGPRRESMEKCADRLLCCLRGISHCNDVFKRWFEKGRSRKSALKKEVDLESREQILRLLQSGRHRRDLDKSIIDDLGFHVEIWNGAEEKKAVPFSAICGSYNINPNLSNAVVLDLPEDFGEVAEKECCTELLAVVARAWEPEWAGVISRASRDSRPFDSPFVDWMVYVNHRDVDQSKLPSTAYVHVIDRLGTIVVVQDRPIDPANPIDLSNVKKVSAAVSECPNY